MMMKATMRTQVFGALMLAIGPAALTLVLTAGAAPSAAAVPGYIHGVIGVAGSVKLEGSRRAPSPIDMGGDAYCVQANAGRQLLDRAVVADAQGRLANVIVYIREAPRPGGAAPQEPALLDQQNCEYIPRVVALRVGQPLNIRNSDQTLHNVHVHSKVNPGFNVGQPMKGLTTTRSFRQTEVGIHVACDIHGWMSGTIAVFDHPFFAVTKEDGAFSIDAVPAGDYVVEAWHETLGSQQQRVTVTAGAPAQVTFTFGGS